MTTHTGCKRRSLLLAGVLAAGCFSAAVAGAQEVHQGDDLTAAEAIIEAAVAAPDIFADEAVFDDVQDEADVPGMVDGPDEITADEGPALSEPIGEGETSSDSDADFQMPSILEAAESCIGVPFAWGGASPETGFDSGGLTQYCYAQAGYEIGRTSYDQAAALEARGAIKYSVEELVPGDLVFPNIGSVGIYAGDGMMITAYPQGAVQYFPITEFAFGGNPTVPVASPEPDPIPDPEPEPDPDPTPVEPTVPGPDSDASGGVAAAPSTPAGPAVSTQPTQGAAALPKTADGNTPFAMVALAIGGILSLVVAGYAGVRSHR